MLTIANSLHNLSHQSKSVPVPIILSMLTTFRLERYRNASYRSTKLGQSNSGSQFVLESNQTRFRPQSTISSHHDSLGEELRRIYNLCLSCSRGTRKPREKIVNALKHACDIPAEKMDSTHLQPMLRAAVFVNAKQEGINLMHHFLATHHSVQDSYSLVNPFRAAIELCEMNRDPYTAWEFVMRMKTFGLFVSASIYTRIINAAISINNPDFAVQVFQNSVREGVDLPIETISKLMLCLSKYFHLLPHTIEVFLITTNRKNPGEIPTALYTLALQACNKCQDSIHAQEILQEMQKIGAFSDTLSDSTTIESLAHSKKFEGAQEMLDNLHDQSDVQLITQRSKLKMLVSGKKCDDAVKLFYEMKATKNLTNYDFNLALRALIDGGMYEQGIDLFKEMDKTGISTNSSTLALTIECLVKANQYQEALRFFIEMEQKNVTIDDSTYLRIIDVCAEMSSLSTALEILQRAESKLDTAKWLKLSHHTLDLCVASKDSKCIDMLYNSIFMQNKPSNGSIDRLILFWYAKCLDFAKCECAVERIEEKFGALRESQISALIMASRENCRKWWAKVKLWVLKAEKYGVISSDIYSKANRIFLNAQQFDEAISFICRMVMLGFVPSMEMLSYLHKRSLKCHTVPEQPLHFDSLIDRLKDFDQESASKALVVASIAMGHERDIVRCKKIVDLCIQRMNFSLDSVIFLQLFEALVDCNQFDFAVDRLLVKFVKNDQKWLNAPQKFWILALRFLSSRSMNEEIVKLSHIIATCGIDCSEEIELISNIGTKNS